MAFIKQGASTAANLKNVESWSESESSSDDYKAASCIECIMWC